MKVEDFPAPVDDAQQSDDEDDEGPTSSSVEKIDISSLYPAPGEQSRCVCVYMCACMLSMFVW